MPTRLWTLLCVLLFYAAPAAANMDPPAKVLRIYGPGGPHHVLDECADLFEERHGIKVEVSRALPHELEQKLREDGDLYYGGAEYMLEEFVRGYPDVLGLASAEKLHPRRIGIIVRKGNPLGIRRVEDLHRSGVDLLDVKLENMRHFYSPRSGRASNIRHFAYTGQHGVSAWQTNPELDAWVTYRSWHLALEDETDFIEIPGDHALRYTPVALTHRTPHREEALAFIRFLKSEEARRLFTEHGWD